MKYMLILLLLCGCSFYVEFDNPKKEAYDLIKHEMELEQECKEFGDLLGVEVEFEKEDSDYYFCTIKRSYPDVTGYPSYNAKKIGGFIHAIKIYRNKLDNKPLYKGVEL